MSSIGDVLLRCPQCRAEHWQNVAQPKSPVVNGYSAQPAYRDRTIGSQQFRLLAGKSTYAFAQQPSQPIPTDSGRTDRARNHQGKSNRFLRLSIAEQDRLHCAAGIAKTSATAQQVEHRRPSAQRDNAKMFYQWRSSLTVSL